MGGKGKETISYGLCEGRSLYQAQSVV